MSYKIEMVELIWICNEQTYRCKEKWESRGTYLESMCTPLEYAFPLLLFYALIN
jgi:hypothetical protein